MFFLLLTACFSSSPQGQQDPVWATDTDSSDHLLVILIDTLRADALKEAHTPHLDSLTKRGHAVSHAWSAGTWTVPSIQSIFTGMPIRQHGWDEPSARIGDYPVLDAHQNLPSVLQTAGFYTAAFYANPYLAEELGMERGFDIWKRSSDTQIPVAFKKHVDTSWNATKRQFTYLHLLGPHSPLRPSSTSLKRWPIDEKWIDPKRGFGIGAAKRNRQEGVRDAYRKAYHAVVEDTDVRIGAILNALGPYAEKTWIIVTSDHGELLGEHNIVGHGTHVYQELTHVPFIVAPPKGRKLPPLPDALVNAVLPDLACRVLGIQSTWPVSLLKPMPLVSQREGILALSSDGQHKGVWSPKNAPKAFDLKIDPSESNPQAPSVELIESHRQWLTETPQGAPGKTIRKRQQQTIDELRALGYQD